ncbi:peroxiredoxin [Saccharothrix carnea]|uniref:Alkyl hydroperoxide reductase E n=1 Tax=Saccharothrix carnea TaxID=1280637 RepID=A0A2P8I4F8_SACCR|nr:peroxiredoxin [Saccharothrix carnea]
MLEIGAQAPDFTLEDNNRRPVTLSSYAGDKSVLLVYYPRAFTPICRGELCQIRDEIEVYRSYNVQVLGVSVDSPFSLKEWAERQKYPFPLLSDFWPHGEVATTYGTFNDAEGIARRGTFLIDTEGIIRFAEVREGDEPRDQNAWKEAVATALGPPKAPSISVPTAVGSWIDLPAESEDGTG